MQESRFNAALEALGDPGKTSIVLVTRPERSALLEAARTAAELSALGMRNQCLVVNGVFHASSLRCARDLLRSPRPGCYSRRGDSARMGRRPPTKRRTRDLKALLVHRHEDVARFDEAFDLFWRAHTKPQAACRSFRSANARASSRRRLPVFRSRSRVTALHRLVRLDWPSGRTVLHVSRTKDFADFTPEEMTAAEAVLAQLGWELGVRRTRRWSTGSSGAIDLRRLVGRNMKHGGELVDLPRDGAGEAAPARRPRGCERIDGAVQQNAPAFRVGDSHAERGVGKLPVCDPADARHPTHRRTRHRARSGRSRRRWRTGAAEHASVKRCGRSIFTGRGG